MSFPPRRVVTGHDARGRAIVASDEPAQNGISRRPGHRSFVLWATETVPADPSAPDPANAPITERSLAEGTIFRIVEYGPSVTPARHQTNSIDYGVVLAGEIDLVLDDQVVHLRAGDTFVQRGTVHDWVNQGEDPCIIAFCLVGTAPGNQAEAPR